eukprot:2568197-Rhodomonas_salina.3
MQHRGPPQPGQQTQTLSVRNPVQTHLSDGMHGSFARVHLPVLDPCHTRSSTSPTQRQLENMKHENMKQDAKENGRTHGRSPILRRNQCILISRSGRL